MKKNPKAMVCKCTTLLLVLLVVVAIVTTSVLLARHHHHRSAKQIPPSEEAPEAWDEVSKLSQYDPKRLALFISPLVTISSNAYGFSATPASVPGWKPSPKVPTLEPSSNTGARGLVYEEDTTSAHKRIVVAFRGTSTQADLCVDRILFGELPRVSLPSLSSCLSTYSNQSLDYVSQGVSYTRQAVEAYPNASLLLTGHSLGAGLAVLVSATLGGPAAVVAFSGPGAGGSLRSRSLQLSPEMKRSMVVIGDEWDTVVTGSWEQQVGTVCLVQHQGASDCAACSVSDGSSTCSNCAFQAHSLNGILDNCASVRCVCDSQ